MPSLEPSPILLSFVTGNPIFGYVAKANFDATMFFESKVFGVSAVIRTSGSSVVGKNFMFQSDPLAAKAFAALHEVFFALECDISVVVIEGDTLDVVNLIPCKISVVLRLGL